MKLWFALAPLFFALASAHAAPPELVALMRAARAYDADLQVQEADIAQRRAAIDLDDGALWPRLEARLGYTRNQHDARFVIPDGAGTREVVITPHDQLDATFTLTVPVLDLGRRARIDAAEHRVDAAVEDQRKGVYATDEAVANAYFNAVFARARADIAKAELTTANARKRDTEVRRDAGFAGPLELARADADIARSQRVLADAELDEANARRVLARLSGTTPSIGPLVVSTDDGALDAWLAKVDRLPAIVALQREADALRSEARAAGLDLVPTVEAFVAERITNATGFGEPDNLQAGVTINWRLDATSFRRDDEIAARVRVNDLRVEAARRLARDRIADVWDQIGNRKARIAAAKAEVSAQEAATTDAEKRQREGRATGLEVDDARRARLAAAIEVARAEAELELARVLLRTAAGVDPTEAP